MKKTGKSISPRIPVYYVYNSEMTSDRDVLYKTWNMNVNTPIFQLLIYDMFMGNSKA